MKTFSDLDKQVIDNEIVEDITSQITEILDKQGRCVLAIAGGRSIASVLDLLATQPLDWSKIHVFAVDDRCVPIESEESNSGLIKKHLVDQVGGINLHPFNYRPELDDRGASEYSKEIEKLGGKFDILVLSSGEDGHVAGLFPNHHSIRDDSEGYIFFDDSPKDPPERVSASRTALLQSQSAFILFVGEGKHAAYNTFMTEDVKIEDCPAKIVQKLPQAFVYTDRPTS